MKDENMKMSKRLAPFILSITLVVFDQITKILVIRNIPIGTIAFSCWNDFLWIIHVRNTGAAFSMGAGRSDFFRVFVFIVLPLAVMVFIGWAIASKKNIFTKAQRWFAAGILGGGIGTLIDRIFRFEDGVVDFISVKFYGLFGMDRWPTFNVSDSCVVVFVILFALSVLFTKENKNG